MQRIRDYIRMGYSARQMVVKAPKGWRGVARRVMRRLARWRLRSLLIEFPFEVWALKAYKATRRAPQPVVIN